MIRADLRTWNNRNAWLLPSGELCVRPGLRREQASTTGYIYVGAFTTTVPGIDEKHHYLFEQNETTKAVRLLVVDEDLRELFRLDLGTTKRPRAVTHAETLNEILISSPDFAPLWGVNGAGIVPAVKEPSDNEDNTPAIPIPAGGLCLSWGDRAVIMERESIYISDPVAATGGSPRTFIGFNQQWRAGFIYGGHVSSSGMLIACTTQGVFGLSPDAVATGQIVAGGWRQLSTHQTHRYRSTAMWSGRLYGLTRRGLRLIDQEGGPEVPLDEPYLAMGRTPITMNDWRDADLFDGELGPIVWAPNHGHWLMSDMARSFRSWWRLPTGSSDTNRLVGTLQRPDGEEMLVTEDGIYRYLGNYDGAYNGLNEWTDEESLPIRGIWFGTIPLTPDDSPTVRSVSLAHDSIRAARVRFCDGDESYPSGSSDEPLRGPVIGTDAWDDAAEVNTTRMRAHRLDMAPTPTRDLALAVEVSGPGTRVMPYVNIDIDGLEPKRPT